MRYNQPGAVKLQSNGEYRVVIELYLTPEERDQWGAGNVRLGLVRLEEVTDGNHRPQGQ